MPGNRNGRLANVCGAVLLGGASRRMGCDKAGLEIEGTASAARVATLLDSICDDVLLVGGTAPPGAPGRPVADAAGPRSSLRGLVAALESAGTESLLAVACDLPLLTPDLLLALVAWPPAAAVVPRSAGRAHPLCGLYRCEEVLPVARARLGAGELALHGLLDELDTAYLEGEELARIDPDGRALTNVNTPEDLERARALFRG